MPVEIKEMVVKAIVPSLEEQERKDEAKHKDVLESPLSNSHLIEECVSAVLRILEKRERR